MKQFLRQAGEAFLIAAGVELFLNAEALIDMGSREQLVIGGIALGRAALHAGFRAIVPRLLALREPSEV